MTRCTAIREYLLAASHHGFFIRDVFLSARRIGKTVRLHLAKESCDVADALFRGLPEHGVLMSILDLKRLLRCQADKPVVKSKPVFGKQADIYINADRGTRHADRVSSVL